MLTTHKIKYFALAALFGTWGCTPNQQVTNNTVVYDDLYGRPAEAVVTNGAPSGKGALNKKEYSNPDFAVANDEINAANGVSNEDYYDENYVTARNYKWDKSAFNGYDIGYNDGYSNALRNTAYTPFNSFGGFYPMSRFSMGFGMGMGMGSFMRFGYDPFMFNSFNNPYMYGGFNSPFMYNGFYDGYAGMWGDPFYGGMYGYGGMSGWGNPFFNRYYGYPTVIINNYEGSRGRTYGPRGSSVATRRNETLRPSNSSYVSSGRSTATGARRSNGDYTTRSSRTSASTGDTYYARPRNTDAYFGGDRASRSSSAGAVNTRSSRTTNATAGDNSGFYSRPRSTTSAAPATGTRSSGSSYQAPSRSYNSTNNSYNRSSNNTYQAPTRSYSNESRSSNSYSAPSRSYSAPSSGGSSSGGGGGGASRSSRGSR